MLGYKVMMSLTQFLASCFRISFCGLLDSLSKNFLTSSKKFLKNVFLLILSFLFFSSASFVAMEVESSLVGGKQEKGVEKFLGFKIPSFSGGKMNFSKRGGGIFLLA